MTKWLKRKDFEETFLQLTNKSEKKLKTIQIINPKVIIHKQ